MIIIITHWACRMMVVIEKNNRFLFLVNGLKIRIKIVYFFVFHRNNDIERDTFSAVLTVVPKQLQINKPVKLVIQAAFFFIIRGVND